MKYIKHFCILYILFIFFNSILFAKSFQNFNLWTELSKNKTEKLYISIPSIAPVVNLAERAVLVIKMETLKKKIKIKIPKWCDYGPFREFFRFFESHLRPDENIQYLGSGFIIHPSGYALTNHHVIENALVISITAGNDKKKYSVKVIGSDPKTDIALLKIRSTRKDWPTIPLGNSDESNVGDFAIAIGHPFGLELSASMGIISAIGRRNVFPAHRNLLFDFIQIDASINAGNSGGPCLNLHGEAIGINTAVCTEGQGIAFTIPINQVKKIITRLKNIGSMSLSWFGIKSMDLSYGLSKTLKLKNNNGIVVREIMHKSPAHKAGFSSGDILLTFNGLSIKNTTSLRFILGLTNENEKVTIKLLHKKKYIYKTLKLERKIISKISKKIKEKIKRLHLLKFPELGLTTSSLSKMVRRSLNIHYAVSGIVVLSVSKDSPADLVGIQANDILTKINGTKLFSLIIFKHLMKNLKDGEILQIYSKRYTNRYYRSLYSILVK